ncbi:MAG: M23 family metallopeptidase, partial [Bacteroidia bacterium]
SGYVAPDSVSVKKEEKVTYLPKDYLKKVEEQTSKQNFETPDLNSKKVDIMGKPIVLFPPVNGILTSKFDIEDHYAIDLAAKANEPIKAIADGYVIFSEYSVENGYMIAIAHSENIISIYKHNSKVFKKTGSFVYVGEPIAVVGNTGENSTGPHLHFELWIQGKPVNPLDYFTYVEK